MFKVSVLEKGRSTKKSKLLGVLLNALIVAEAECYAAPIRPYVHDQLVAEACFYK